MRDRPTYRTDQRSALTATAPRDARLGLVVMASPVASALGRVLAIPASGEAVVIQRVAEGHDEDDWMSREHASVWRDGERVSLRDGADTSAEGWRTSANGTYVSSPLGSAEPARLRPLETKAEGEVTLAPGSLVRTGRTLWRLVNDPAPSPPDSLLVGVSDALARVRDELKLLVAEVALRFERKKRVTQSLLVTGPRGTGKQVVAHEAHRLLTERRAVGALPFVDVPAPALADGTSAADLFGVVDKYATDVKARPGYFERAHGGVLLIDEVADLPLSEQAKLLNLLEERRVTRLGGRAPVDFDCLVIAATNGDLPALVADGRFRADLLDRLSRFHVHLPALDERPEDVLPLARTLLRRHASNAPLSWEVALVLARQRWPGSVRALDAFIERLVAIARSAGSEAVERAHVEQALRALEVTVPLAPSVGEGAAAVGSAIAREATGPARAPTRDELLRCLVDHGWNKTEVGRIYGKHPRQITRWMSYLGIERPQEEGGGSQKE